MRQIGMTGREKQISGPRRAGDLGEKRNRWFVAGLCVPGEKVLEGAAERRDFTLVYASRPSSVPNCS